MKLMMLLFVATTAKNVDPHGVEAFAAAKLGSPEVFKAPVMPDEEKDSFESAFDGGYQLARRGLSAMNRRVLKKGEGKPNRVGMNIPPSGLAVLDPEGVDG